jgi:hypothetical protein
MAFGHLLKYLLQGVLEGSSSSSSGSSSSRQQHTLSRMLASGSDSSSEHPHTHSEHPATHTDGAQLLLLCVLGLRGGSMKLQHAYLNVINVVLHYSTATDAEGAGNYSVVE